MDSVDTSGYQLTYYAASTPSPPRLPPLLGATHADICVLGGGIAGCACALALAERGYRVVLLEAERIGWGASGRNGGQVIVGAAAEQEDLAAMLGGADARRVWDVTLDAVARVRARIAQHAIDCHWVDGELFTAVKARQWRALERWQAELAGRYDYPHTRLVPRMELRSLLATDRYVGGLYDRHSGHLHPLRYTLGLAAAARAAGAQLHEGSRVLGYDSTATRVRVRTAHGEVDCAQLVLAGNAWLADTVPVLQRKLMTIATYVVATEPLGEATARALIGNDAAVCDMNWILDYYRRSRDHRLLFGGRVNYSGIDVRRIAPATRRRMVNVYPQLRDARIEFAWGCLLDITLNRAPDFGRLAPNVYYLQGFSGHGVALATIAGELIAETVAGSAERFDLLARIPHREFPGGRWLRRPALVLAMLWYRLRDLI